jgi:hypothetical protein
MQHILLSALLIGISLLISGNRNGIERGYLVLSPVPLALLLIAKLHELAFGFSRFAEVIYHFAYDTSYILMMVGIVLLLRAIIKKGPEKALVLGAGISAIPVVALIISGLR